MAKSYQPCLFLLFFVFSLLIDYSICLSNSPQNIETFYPSDPPSSAPTLSPPIQQSQPPPPPPPPSKKSSTRKAVGTAVGVTAACTLVLAGLFFFFLQRCRTRRRDQANNGSGRPQPIVQLNSFQKFERNLKGLIVDENGLDVVYWRKLEGSKYKNSYRKEVLHKAKDEGQDEEEKRVIYKAGSRRKKAEPIQETPLLRGKSSTSQNPISPENKDFIPIKDPELRTQSSGITLMALEKQQSIKFQPQPPILEISEKQSPSPPPPRPPPPLPITAKKNPAPPPPPPIAAKKNPVPPPPPPKTGSLSSSSKPPPVPKVIASDAKIGKSSSGNSDGQVKLKPLHWDKVNANVDHSMVWDKLDGGSFRFDGDLMEALFGTVATNRKSPNRENNSLSTNNVPSQIFILDSRKSQNIAIVLRSLAISRKELIDALNEGQGLDADTLEKLSRITLTKEEESQILAYHGDPTRLAHAETFLYYLLKAIPSAFPRLSAMLFRSNYDNEISHLKESLHILESGCQELRRRGLFLKLLEAILKAGNRMNAGTARGNAQAFNLTSLTKLSDVKSTDGKTTLLHFVVEEVVRSEGKRCVLNRNRSLGRSNSKSSSSMHSGNSHLKEDKEKEYMMLGLPIVGGLSAEFSNVKKAATIDYDALAKACSGLAARAAEIRQIVVQCAAMSGGREGEGFVKEMRGFLEAAEGELSVVKKEQTRFMELVKKTTEYYQAASSKDKESNPLQLFVIVKDFLGMVDQVCVEIARNQQKRKNVGNAGSPSTKSPAIRSPVNFPNLPEHFMSDRSGSTSSDSSDGF